MKIFDIKRVQNGVELTLFGARYRCIRMYPYSLPFTPEDRGGISAGEWEILLTGDPEDFWKGLSNREYKINEVRSDLTSLYDRGNSPIPTRKLRSNRSAINRYVKMLGVGLEFHLTEKQTVGKSTKPIYHAKLFRIDYRKPNPSG